jgi:hypothetical protein
MRLYNNYRCDEHLAIFLLWEHYIKSIAERSYSLLRGREVTIQMSLPGDIPVSLDKCYEGPGQKYGEYRVPYLYGHCRAPKSPVAQRSL